MVFINTCVPKLHSFTEIKKKIQIISSFHYKSSQEMFFLSCKCQRVKKGYMSVDTCQWICCLFKDTCQWKCCLFKSFCNHRCVFKKKILSESDGKETMERVYLYVTLLHCYITNQLSRLQIYQCTVNFENINISCFLHYYKFKFRTNGKQKFQNHCSLLSCCE